MAIEITADKLSFNDQANLQGNVNADGDVMLTTGTATAAGAQFEFKANGKLAAAGDDLATELFVEGATQQLAIDLAQQFATKQYVDQKVAAATPGAAPAFTAATLSAGWANHGNTPNYAQANAGYRKHADGTVELTGLVDGQASGTNIFNLPSGFRPAKQQSFVVNCAFNGDNVGFIKVQPNGNVYFSGGVATLVFLTGIRFPLI